MFAGSPLLFHTHFLSQSSHPVAALLVAALGMIWLFAEPRMNPWRWLAMGLLLGCAMAVRGQLFVVATLPAVEWLTSLRDPRARPFAACNATLALAGAVIGLSPQLLLWRVVSGSWFDPVHGGVMSLEGFAARDVLLSANRGLLVWTPVMAAGFLGSAVLMRSRISEGVALAAAFVLNLLLVSCVAVYWGGLGFGQRYFTDLFWLAGVGLAALQTSVSARPMLRRLFDAGCVAGVTWSVALVCAGEGRLLSLFEPVRWRDMLHAVAQLPSQAVVILQHVVLPKESVPAGHLAWFLLVACATGGMVWAFVRLIDTGRMSTLAVVLVTVVVMANLAVLRASGRPPRYPDPSFFVSQEDFVAYAQMGDILRRAGYERERGNERYARTALRLFRSLRISDPRIKEKRARAVALLEAGPRTEDSVP